MICSWKKRAFLAVLGGLVLPLSDLIVSCSQPTSAECIWSRAYLPLSLSLGLGVVGVALYLILWLVSKVVCKKSKTEENGEP